MMPAAISTSTNGSAVSGAGSEIQIVYDTYNINRLATGISDDAAKTLRLALRTVDPTSAQSPSAAIKAEPSEDSVFTGEYEPQLVNGSVGSSGQAVYTPTPLPSTSSAPFTDFVGGSSSYSLSSETHPGSSLLNGFTHAPVVALRQQVATAPDALGPDDIPPPPPHPTDPDEIRRLMRSKMIRCKRCQNRFVERDLYERHLKEKHLDDYILYMEEQAREMEEQRILEIEQMKREELLSGGFIPPSEDIDAALNYADLDPSTIPLPGEETGGIAPTFDRWGGIRMPRRTYPYKKKISPQCPFCDKRFRNENSLKKHIAKKHPAYLNFIQCNHCFKALKSNDDLPTHLCELMWICFQCTPIRNMCTQDRLDSHRSKFHRGTNSGFRCNECSRKFLTPRKLRKHKKMAHVVTKPFKCHFCDEYFPTDTQVSLHERIHTGKVKYECNVCDYRTNRWVKLDKHKREDHGYLCSICHEKMTEWGELKYHTLEKHGGYLSSESQAVSIESPRVWVLLKGE